MVVQKGIYPHGKKKCLIFSYDDDRDDNMEIAALLKRYGMRGTFNLNGHGLVEDGTPQTGDKKCLYKSQVKELSRDFEIACHGYVHPPYGYMDTAQCVQDLLRDRQALEDILKVPVRGFALPSGVYSRETVEALRIGGIAYSRTIDCTDGFDLPQNFLEWHPTAKHDDFGKLFAAGEAYIKGSWRLRNYLSCMLIYGHSYELAAPEKRQRFEGFLQLMAGREDIWYTSCMELCNYLKALGSLIMTVDGSCVINPTLTDVWVMVDGEPHCVEAGETKYF